MRNQKTNSFFIFLVICSLFYFQEKCSCLQVKKNNNGVLLDSFIKKSNLELKKAKKTFFKVKKLRLEAAKTGDKYLHLSQIVCYDESFGNALEKQKVTASPGIGPTPASAVVNGLFQLQNYPYIYHSKDQNGAFIEIELAEEKNIFKCVIYNRNDCCQNKIVGATFSLYDAENNLVAIEGISSDAKIIDVTFGGYLQVIMPEYGDKFLHLSQIECFDRQGKVLTKNKPVTASSIKPNSKLWYINNGSHIFQRFPLIFHSGKQNGDWLRIKLEVDELKSVYSCWIINRKDCCQEKFQLAKIQKLDAKLQPYESILVKKTGDQMYYRFESAKYIYLKQTTNSFNLSQIACYDFLTGNNVLKGAKIEATNALIDPNVLVDGTYHTRDKPNVFTSNKGQSEILIHIEKEVNIDYCLIYTTKDKISRKTNIGAFFATLASDLQILESFQIKSENDGLITFKSNYFDTAKAE